MLQTPERRVMRLRPARLSLIISLAVACSGPTAPDVHGTWGGAEASLTLNDSGGTLAYPCGAGTIDAGWTLDRGGRFGATGQHYFGGGPVPPAGHPPHPARYAGLIRGAYLTLTVTLTDLDQSLGPFRLMRDGPRVSEQCL
jgi:hypothetical protein